jgi:hypothetical protein
MTRQLAFISGVLLAAASALAQAPLNINGVTDKSTYTDTASFSVPSTAGYSQVAFLNNQPVSSDVTHVVNRADYYEVTVMRTNNSTFAVSNRTVRFIIQSSNRGSPEKGLIEWLPYPGIPSASAEFAGANMRLIVPQAYPAGLEIPVIAWIQESNGDARRANGYIRAAGFESSPVKILRGVGSGFLPRQVNAGTITYNAQLHSLAATKQVNIDQNTTWTTVSGMLTGDVVWTNNSRIHVTSHLFITNGATLTVGAGAVVKLNSLVTITNYGRIVINGTDTQPVVFTSTNHIVPDYNVGAWGGFVMRTNGAEMSANYLIVNGAGGATSWNFSPGSSHKSHQPVFHLHFGAKLSMTNSAVINTHGQLGNGYRATMNLERCLVQRAITCGEWDTCTNVVSRSALIEFPEENGAVNPTIVDYDYDGFYMIKGTNCFKDSLLGFCKDDALDAGSDSNSDSLGSVRVEHCWIESALHESMAWSGHNRKTFVYDTVSMNSGQGIENGWTDGGSSFSGTQTSPDIYAERLLATGNSVGARVGDNYNWAYRGFMRITNSLILNNYRDVFLRTWNGVGVSWDTNSWEDRLGQIVLENTALTATDERFPAGDVWNPSSDAARLAFWMATPPNAPVGVGIATWTNVNAMAAITNGVPVRLSTFTTNVVSVDYSFENAAGTLASGTLTFQPGETVKRAFPAGFNSSTQSLVRVALRLPAGGEITGQQQVFFMNQAGTAALINAGAVWNYYDKGLNLGTGWRAPDYDDSGWSNGAAQLGFGDNPRDEVTFIQRTNAAGTASVTTFYFRRAFNVTNASSFASLSMWMLRDDGGVVYINGNEVFRSSSIPAGTVTYSTFANALGSAPSDNTIDTATISATNLVEGTNIVAVEIHQYDPPSSDASFDFSLTANPKSSTPQHIWWEPSSAPGGFNLLWDDSAYTLEKANTVTGVWTKVLAPSPITVSPTNQQEFFRLK